MHTVHSSYDARWKYKDRLRWKFCELVLYCVFGHGKVLKSWKLIFFFRFLHLSLQYFSNLWHIHALVPMGPKYFNWKKNMVSGDFLFTFSVCIIYRWLVPVTNHHVFESISPHNHHNYPDQCGDDHHNPDLTGQS